MQPIPLTVTSIQGGQVHVRLSDTTELNLPAQFFPADVKIGEVVSLLAVRGSDLLNEILRDEQKS